MVCVYNQVEMELPVPDLVVFEIERNIDAHNNDQIPERGSLQPFAQAPHYRYQIDLREFTVRDGEFLGDDRCSRPVLAATINFLEFSR